MMKQICKATSAAALLAALVLSAGCATTQGLAQQYGVRLENIDSSSVRIIRTYLDATEQATILRGELELRIPAYGPLPGHLHVELIGPDGKVMKEADIGHLHKSIKSRSAEFSLPLPEPLVPGSTIRVTHHDAKSHAPEVPSSPWRDANPDKE